MLCHAAHLMFYYEKEIKNLSVTYASSFRVNFQSSVGRADHLPVKTDHSYQTYYYKVILMIHFILSPAFETVMYLHPIIYSHLKYVSIPTISKKKSCFENINVYIVI